MCHFVKVYIFFCIKNQEVEFLQNISDLAILSFNRPRCKSVEKQDVIRWESHGSLKNVSSLNMDLCLVDLLHVTFGHTYS